MANRSSTPNLADALEEEWETVQTGLGSAYDPEIKGPLVGDYIGSTSKLINDRDQTVHQFAPVDDPSAVYFIWGGYELDEAMSNIDRGTRCRVSFAGRDQFKAKDGKPRQIKHYKVQTKK